MKAAFPTTIPSSITTGNCNISEDGLKIALDATPLTLSSGGLRRYTAELAPALAREFPEDIYTLMSDQPFRLPPDSPVNLQSCVPAGGGRRWWLNGVRKAIRSAGAQLFHGTNFEVPYVGSTPAIMTIHDLSPWSKQTWRDDTWNAAAQRVRIRTPWLLRLRRARMIVTVSEAVRREVIDYFGLRRDRVRAVSLAAAPAFVPPAEPLPSPPRPFFLFVGTLERRKNVASLIEAWAATRAETGADLIIVGQKRAGFPMFAPAEGLRIMGEIPERELPGLYCSALAFVYPSHYEGFGLPVLEAMQCGCPVITSRDPAISEVSGGAAILAGTSLELADALRSVANDAGLRNELGRAGIRRARNFSWAKTAQATREIYAEVLREASAREVSP